MDKKFILLFCLLLILPNIVMADDMEIVITLHENTDSCNLCSDYVPPVPSTGGDDPNGNDDKHPRPNQFRATITGRTLAITAENNNFTYVIVRNAVDDSVVMHTRFVGCTSNRLSASGNYVINICSGNLTLVGQFVTQ